MVTSGRFLLKEYRPRERTLVARNPAYFDSALVDVSEIEFFAGDGVTVLNLFRLYLVNSMEGRVLPLQSPPPNLRQSPALRLRPACACHNWRISTTRAPLDNVILRYALNMATDKDATVAFLGTGQKPAISRVLHLDGYRSPTSLAVNIKGSSCDVLSYNPRRARGALEF